MPKEENARIAAERFRAAIAGIDWRERELTVSVGASTISQAVQDAASLIARADTAMYRSKSRGGNCVSHVDDVEPAGELPASWRSALLPPRTLELRTANENAALETVKQNLQHSCDAMVACWSRLPGFGDEGTWDHSVRVAEMMEMLAQAAGMDDKKAVQAKHGALLHDIGKLVVPSAILNKPGPLSDEEWKIMQCHPAVASEMLASMGFTEGPTVEIPHYHHERWDGSGYPRGLKGKEIPLAARLFAVIDVYDALTSDRPYRKAWSKSDALRYLQDEVGTQFDPDAVEALARMFQGLSGE